MEFTVELTPGIDGNGGTVTPNNGHRGKAVYTQSATLKETSEDDIFALLQCVAWIQTLGSVFDW